MDIFQELLRIADKQVDEQDAVILRCAAFSLPPVPTFEKVTKIPGYGYYIVSQYGGRQ